MQRYVQSLIVAICVVAVGGIARVREGAEQLQNVSFLGPLTESEKMALIQLASLNIIMSRSEALGIAQLEFMWSGVPVVTSGTGGQQWIVRDGVNGLVLEGPDDMDGAVRAVLKLCENESLRRKLGRNARTDVRRFSITRLIYSLSKRLEALSRRISDDKRLREGMEADEDTLEAMVDGGLTVVVTNRRLILSSNDGNRKPIALPIDDIGKITTHVRSHWQALVLGFGATGLLLVSRMIQSRLEDCIRNFTVPFPMGTLLDDFMPFIPLVVAIPVFLATFRRGYVVHSGVRRIFVPRQFLRALKLVDKLTPNDLFVDEPE